MYGVDKYGKRVEITVRSSLVGRSFHSITIECVEDLKILPRIQWRLLWRHNQQKSNKSVIFNIPAFSPSAFFKKYSDKIKSTIKTSGNLCEANPTKEPIPTQLHGDPLHEKKHYKQELLGIAERFPHEFPKQTPFDKIQ